MSERGPVEQLVLVVLIAAIKKGAAGIGIAFDPDVPDEGQVRFVFTGDTADAPPTIAEEMRPPAPLIAPMIAKLAALADIPAHPHDGSAEGTLAVTLSAGGPTRFAIHISGHGPTLAARLRRLAN